MKWQGVDESSREKVESLINAFDAFIIKNHKSSQEEDDRIRREWLAFKNIIQEKPGETNFHNKYVMDLRNALLKEEVSKNKNVTNQPKEYVPKKEARRKIVIDKPKLALLAKEIKRAFLRNTKDPLDLLE